MYTATSNEKVMELLNTWYIEMRARRIGNAQRLKEKIDIKIQKLKNEKEEALQDQNLLLYYVNVKINMYIFACLSMYKINHFLC